MKIISNQRPTPEEISARFSKNPDFYKEGQNRENDNDYRARWLEAETIISIAKHYKISIEAAQYRAKRLRIKGHAMKPLTTKKERDE